MDLLRTAHAALLLCFVLTFGWAHAAPAQALTAPHPYAWPELTLLYSCDEGEAKELNKRILIPDGYTRVIKAEPEEVVYFIVDALFNDKDGKIKHTRMHFVLGSRYADGARAIVNGKDVAGNDTESLVKLEKGWLWVSDAAPPNWSGQMPPSVTVAPKERSDQDITTGPIVSWSLITLIRGLYTHSGADMTEFTFAIKELEEMPALLFVTKTEQVAYHRKIKDDGTLENVEVTQGEYSDTDANGDPASPKPIDDGNSPNPKRLMDYIKCRVADVRAVPVGSSECHERHKGCLPTGRGE